MEMHVGIIATRFIGLNKVMVDSYIQTLIKQHTERVADYKRQVESQLSEKEKLTKQLDELHLQENASVMSEEFKEFITERSYEISGVLAKAADTEIEEIVTSAKQNMDEYDNEISTIQIEIQNTKDHIDLLLKDAVKMLNEQKEKDMPNDTLEENEPVEAPNLGFWDDVSEAYFIHREEKIEEAYYVKQDSIETKEEKIEEAYCVMQDNIETKEEKIEEVYYFKQDSNEIKNEPVKDDINESQTSNNTKSEALATEINLIRSRYLVGKIVGEDIQDKEGKVIIAKNDVITKEVVEQADSEGRLAELIIKMTLPELGG